MSLNIFIYRYDLKLHYVKDVLKFYKQKKNVPKQKRQKVQDTIQTFISNFEPIEFGFFTLEFAKGAFSIIPRKKAALLSKTDPDDFDEIFGPLNMDEYERDVVYFTHPRKWSDEQWNFVSLWDFVTAYQLKATVCKLLGDTPPRPIFKHALRDMSETDKNGYLDAIAPYLPPKNYDINKY